MRRLTGPSILLLIVVGGTLPLTAQATNGYFQIGYGAESVGMGGASVANPQSALAAAANPAGMAYVGEGWSAGARLFSPKRDASLDCRTTGLACTSNVSADSERELFIIPDFGYVKKINDRVYAGISVFGNGGMNTHYERNIFDEALARSFAGIPSPPSPFPGGLPAGATATGTPGTGTLGVNLSQLLIAPTLTYKLNESNTLGLSLVGGFQTFSARGLGNFAALSSDPGSLTNRQSDASVGLGVRIGWQGQINPMITLGATAASKVYMTKFEKYSGLFADGGSFDIPANFAFGMAIQATPKLKFAFDVQRILYSDVESINNSGPTAAEFAGAFGGALPDPSRALGASNGIGFGWESSWVFKVGAKYQYNKRWGFSAGYNHGQSPISSSETLFNILAPGVVEDHATVGVSYQPTDNDRWTVSYMHAFENSQSNPSTAFLGAAARVSMYQDALNIGYSRRF